MRALKSVFQKHFGLGTVLGTIAVLIAIGAPAFKQGEVNGSTAKAIQVLGEEQKASDERQTRAIADAVTRIESAVNRNNDLTMQNSTEIRSMRDSFDRRIDQVANKADAAWNNMVELKGRVGKIEADKEKR